MIGSDVVIGNTRALTLVQHAYVWFKPIYGCAISAISDNLPCFFTRPTCAVEKLITVWPCSVTGWLTVCWTDSKGELLETKVLQLNSPEGQPPTVYVSPDPRSATCPREGLGQPECLPSQHTSDSKAVLPVSGDACTQLQQKQQQLLYAAPATPAGNDSLTQDPGVRDSLMPDQDQPLLTPVLGDKRSVVPEDLGGTTGGPTIHASHVHGSVLESEARLVLGSSKLQQMQQPDVDLEQQQQWLFAQAGSASSQTGDGSSSLPASIVSAVLRISLRLLNALAQAGVGPILSAQQGPVTLVPSKNMDASLEDGEYAQSVAPPSVTLNLKPSAFTEVAAAATAVDGAAHVSGAVPEAKQKQAAAVAHTESNTHSSREQTLVVTVPWGSCGMDERSAWRKAAADLRNHAGTGEVRVIVALLTQENGYPLHPASLQPIGSFTLSHPLTHSHRHLRTPNDTAGTMADTAAAVCSFCGQCPFDRLSSPVFPVREKPDTSCYPKDASTCGVIGNAHNRARPANFDSKEHSQPVGIQGSCRPPSAQAGTVDGVPLPSFVTSVLQQPTTTECCMSIITFPDGTNPALPHLHGETTATSLVVHLLADSEPGLALLLPWAAATTLAPDAEPGSADIGSGAGEGPKNDEHPRGAFHADQTGELEPAVSDGTVTQQDGRNNTLSQEPVPRRMQCAALTSMNTAAVATGAAQFESHVQVTDSGMSGGKGVEGATTAPRQDVKRRRMWGPLTAAGAEDAAASVNTVAARLAPGSLSQCTPFPPQRSTSTASMAQLEVSALPLSTVEQQQQQPDVHRNKRIDKELADIGSDTGVGLLVQTQPPGSTQTKLEHPPLPISSSQSAQKRQASGSLQASTPPMAEDGELLASMMSPLSKAASSQALLDGKAVSQALPAVAAGTLVARPGAREHQNGPDLLAQAKQQQLHGQQQQRPGQSDLPVAGASGTNGLRAFSPLRGVCLQLHGMLAVASAMSSLSGSPRGGLGMASLALQLPLGCSRRQRLTGAVSEEGLPSHCRVSRRLLHLCLACDWVLEIDF